MKIAVIGANGNLGQRLMAQGIERHYEMTGIVRSEARFDRRAAVLQKSLFDLTPEDVKEFDALISAYGSGFQADPVLNFQAFEKYIELGEACDIRIVAISGAGSLYTDESKTILGYESPGYPGFLKGISSNIHRGIEEIRKHDAFPWVIVSPASRFDAEGPRTGNVTVDDREIAIKNGKGESYVTYEDLAGVMLDQTISDDYIHKHIMAVSEE